MPKSNMASVLHTERQSIDQEIARLEHRRSGIDNLLKDYGHGPSSFNRSRTTSNRKPAGKTGDMSNMEMVRQVLKGSNHSELSVKELRAAIQTKFRSGASKNLPQILHKAAGNKSSIYKNGRTGKYGLLEWKGNKKAS